MTTLFELAQQQAQLLAQRDDILAVAITGAVARSTAWAGSDIDLWALTTHADERFEDGTLVDHVWEADLKPLVWLHGDPQVWLTAPPLENHDGITPVEALWGCQVVVDKEGTLTRYQQMVAQCMTEAGWLQRRAENYLHYGRGILEGLQHADPLRAMVLAREVAVKYGLTAYWMKRGQLLSGMTRLPEQLADTPDVQYLLRYIFALNGQVTLDEFFQHVTHLHPEIQKQITADLTYMVRPAYQHGNYEGALLYIRRALAQVINPYELLPVLGFPVNQVQFRAQLLPQVWHLLERV